MLTVPMKSCESVTVMIWCHVGSRFEGDKIAGLSHFLEHMVLKGSKKRPSAKEIATAVDGLGGEFNAATSKEWTNFYIRASKNNLEKAFDILSDMVLNPLIKKEEVQREKGVILEEKAMYEDTPLMNIPDVFEESIFAGNTLGRGTIGTQKAIKEVTRDDFLHYRSEYYHPENMLVTVAGGVKEEEVTNLAKKYLNNYMLKTTKLSPSAQKFESKQVGPQIKLKNQKS